MKRGSFGFGGDEGRQGAEPRRDSDRCVSEGAEGRCQLRGTIGAVGEHAHLQCLWHQVAGSRPGGERTFKAFCEWLRENKALGYTLYDGRTAAEWWDLIQGKPGPGGFASAGTDQATAQHRKSRERFEKEMKEHPEWYLKGLDIWENRENIGKIPAGGVE